MPAQDALAASMASSVSLHVVSVGVRHVQIVRAHINMMMTMKLTKIMWVH